MKKIVLIILIILHSCSKSHNDFIISKEYSITNIDSLSYENYFKKHPNGDHPISIFLKNSSNNKLKEFVIETLLTYDGAKVEELIVNRFDNVEKVLRVSYGYDGADCILEYSKYFIVTNSKQLIDFPLVENQYCDGPTPIIEYRFPNQKFGTPNQIILVKSFLNDDFKVKSIKEIKSYKWDGKSIELEK